MKLRGMGEEVLRVPLDQIRRLNELPVDVEIVRVLPPPKSGGYGDEWIAGDKPFPGLFLHIRHRYLTRVPPGASMTCDWFERVLVRYREISDLEASKKGEPIPIDDVTGQYDHWIDDNAAP